MALPVRNNRRNYYRVLHVQPDAPAEVIRAAYRALMTRAHPDAGGDTDEAALLNSAWEVLGDPAARSRYDAERAVRAADRAQARAASPHAGASAPASAPRDASPRATSTTGTHYAVARHCAFCALPLAVPELRCPRCTAPLTQMATTGGSDRAGDRRRLPRVSRTDWAQLRLQWDAKPIDVRMRNLSPGGVSVFSGTALAPHQRVRITAAAVDAVVQVMSCHRHGDVYVVHGAFVTALFVKPSGSFVHATA